MIIGRVAHILPNRMQTERNVSSGINVGWLSFGGYFSTQSSTLPAAQKQATLTLRPWSIVTKILYDKDTQESNRR